MQGLVNILKPTGLTSSDVVIRVRGILRRIYGEKYKVGHLGTLDPGASGILIITIGKATRLFDLLSPSFKKYRAAITFGKTTDTLDSYGQITGENSIIPSEDDIRKALNGFIGEIDQIPPNYSALSINGVKAYDMARNGVDFSLESRKILINNIEIVDKLCNNTYVIDIDCKGGTYIRSLVRDIAFALNTVAYMSFLIRLSSGNFLIYNSVTLEEFEKEQHILSIDSVLNNFVRYDIPEKYKKNLLNGVSINISNLPDGQFLVYLENELFGIAHNNDNNLVIDIRL